MPAEDADRVRRASEAIGREAERYVVSELLEPWEKVKRQIAAGRVDPKIQALINEMDQHILDLPTRVVHDVISEIPMLTFGNFAPLETFNSLVIAARGSGGYISPSDALELRRRLNGRKILDEVAERMNR